MSDDLREFFGNNIFSYTRAMAIADGVLIDISDIAKEAGFKVPVAVTDTLYNSWIEPDQWSKNQGQSSSGRIWDILMHLHYASKSAKSDTVFINVVFASKDGSMTVKIKAVIGPGDTVDPVLTIMFPHED
ncbi:hypothetical protein EW093_00955 [Thiospirochaeta perfilievii]|uniref:Uncharacterized protein n=1 Tax=Thiospirochaeta perfilievii TaxID=252967 RepID=A0A5C1Q7D0_9SPIO|nr:DUF6573 family protein [Thiospirochaeta perfilievii]QEN03331.1 hypothetical protein EW093_00955 [Thiospirochaeta perfilievii]